MKRLLDMLISFSALILLSPLLLILAFWVWRSSPGGAFYFQERAGKGGLPFWLIKFRTMRPAAEKAGLLSLGEEDPRITKAGRFLRKYKLDELPQLWNVLKGDMSLVGPRPEVMRYVAHYSEEQWQVLSVRPGLTDPASLEYIDEGALLAASDDPEKTYLEEILPRKLALSLAYVETRSLGRDLHILWKTFLGILGCGRK